MSKHIGRVISVNNKLGKVIGENHTNNTLIVLVGESIEDPKADMFEVPAA